MFLFRLALPLSLLLLVSCTRPQTESLYEQLGLEEITLDQLMQGFESGEFTSSQIVQAYLDRIESIDRNGPQLNSMLTLNPDALETANRLDQERKEGSLRGPLHGIPIVLKDNIDMLNLPTTAGSRVLEFSTPERDAFITERLREQGAIILGKANLSEWANFHSSFSSSGWSLLGGQVKNPYELSRNPCGSSSGPAVALSANLTPLAIGTETNGSIVCPSGANGIVGMKPTVGLWSRSGIIPISYSTDSAGPMARTVRDAAILLGALAGIDPDDEKTLAAENQLHSDYTVFLNKDGLAGKRIGLYTAPLGGHFRVDTLMVQTVRKLEDLGAEIIEIDQISEQNIGGAAFQVLLYEFRDGLNNYLASLGESAPIKDIEELAEQIRSTPEETARFDRDLIFQAAELGGLESEEYREALERMLLHSREEGIDRVMDEHQLDALVAPTGSPAWKTDLLMGDNLRVGSSSPSARAGYPIISLPMGHLDGMPVGISFFGRAWSEPVLLEIAYAFEQATLHRRVPEFRE
ncbi:MAG: amidase [Balneolaceae bacterium]